MVWSRRGRAARGPWRRAPPRPPRWGYVNFSYTGHAGPPSAHPLSPRAGLRTSRSRGRVRDARDPAGRRCAGVVRDAWTRRGGPGTTNILGGLSLNAGADFCTRVGQVTLVRSHRKPRPKSSQRASASCAASGSSLRVLTPSARSDGRGDDAVASSLEGGVSRGAVASATHDCDAQTTTKTQDS